MSPAAAARKLPTPEPAADPSKSSDVVMIACKLPHGLVLELIEPGTLTQPAPTGKRVTLAGANSLRQDKRVAQGEFHYAVTPVDREFWREWLKRNASLEFVKQGFVFEAPDLAHAEAAAKERQGLRTGLEALAQEKDPRVAQGARSGGVSVETDTDALARTLAAPT